MSVVIISLDSLREKRSVPLASQVLHVLKILAAHGSKSDLARSLAHSEYLLKAVVLRTGDMIEI